MYVIACTHLYVELSMHDYTYAARMYIICQVCTRTCACARV